MHSYEKGGFISGVRQRIRGIRQSCRYHEGCHYADCSAWGERDGSAR